MTGEIGGNTIFHIPQEYENMLTQLQQGLIDALKATMGRYTVYS